MTKFTIFLWIIISSCLGLVIYQNRLFFLAEQNLAIEIVSFHYKTPDLPIVLYFVSIFLLGWLVAFVSGLAGRFNAATRVRKLQRTIKEQQSAFDAMKKDIEALKPKPVEKVEDDIPVTCPGPPPGTPGEGQTDSVPHS